MPFAYNETTVRFCRKKRREQGFLRNVPEVPLKEKRTRVRLRAWLGLTQCRFKSCLRHTKGTSTRRKSRMSPLLFRRSNATRRDRNSSGGKRWPQLTAPAVINAMPWLAVSAAARAWRRRRRPMRRTTSGGTSYSPFGTPDPWRSTQETRLEACCFPEKPIVEFLQLDVGPVDEHDHPHSV